LLPWLNQQWLSHIRLDRVKRSLDCYRQEQAWNLILLPWLNQQWLSHIRLVGVKRTLDCYRQEQIYCRNHY
ncbi:hypothetical protein OAI33_14130, partial [Pirellulaceae bacterium]|nr:hypothetical protein [Pirellulaceae bacterium]